MSVMTAHNLIPMPRLEKRRKSSRVRAWVFAVAGYACVMVLGLVLAAAAWERAGGASGAELEALQEQNATRKKVVQTLGAQMEGMQRRLSANKSVGDQPDWSILLTLLGRVMEGEAGIRRCTLRPAPVAAAVKAGGKPGEKPEGKAEERAESAGYILKLTATAGSQMAVSRVVLALEGTGMFDRVELLESKREAVEGRESVVFDVECTIGATKGRKRP